MPLNWSRCPSTLTWLLVAGAMAVSRCDVVADDPVGRDRDNIRPSAAGDSETPHGTTPADEDLLKAISQRLAEIPVPTEVSPNSVSAHSRRGDALFFLGRFSEAVDEYRAMVRCDPELDRSHWRLGIALFYAGNPQAAAAQFERYHSFDDVDRENGIWRYLSQYRASGREVAQKELLKYQKDDREPFPAVYRLFEGTLTAEEVIQRIPTDLSVAEQDSRLFYSELYIGLHLVVQNQPKAALPWLRRAADRKWPQAAGFGPNYMWHVARLQRDLMAVEILKKSTEPRSSNAH